MRIFVIRDDELPGKDLGYLMYYEQAKTFYIELPDDADEWETPLILSSFVRRGEYSVDAYWSLQWVRQRIVPQDRQNLGQILKDNHLKEYDELALLLPGQGRCAQDSLFIEELDDVPETIAYRWNYKLEDVIPLENCELLAFFRDGTARRISVSELVHDNRVFAPYLSGGELFRKVALQPDGYGVCWSDSAVLSDHLLYQSGESVPLKLEDFCHFVTMRIVNTAEAQRLLGCSRQNISDLVKRDKLHPVRIDGNNRMFRLAEVQQRMRAQ